MFGPDLNLDVDAPEKLETVLRAAAEKFRESETELQSAWQDPKAGRVWREFAKILEAAADKAKQAVDKYV